MNRRTVNRLPALTESFFREYLQSVRGASPHTIRAYRDTLRLLLTFAAETQRRSAWRICSCRTYTLIWSSPSSGSWSRGVPTRRSPETVVLRQSADSSKHLIRHDPTRAEQYHRVLSLPSKKAKHAVASYDSQTTGHHRLFQPVDVAEPRRVLHYLETLSTLGFVQCEYPHEIGEGVAVVTRIP